MASLIDLLGLGAGAMVGARTAADERVTAERAAEQQGLLDRLKAEQEAQDREQRRRLTDAQIGNFESQASARQQPSQSPQARAQYDARLGWVLPPDEQNPQGRVVAPEGFSPRETPEARRNIDPLSPEGIEASQARERALATVRAETGDRSISRPTESQEKSYLYGKFMADALPTIDSLAPKANGRAISFALGRGVQYGEDLLGPGALTGDMLSDTDQQLINAARMFTAGLLRKESGAAITPAELRDTFQRFIPLGTDSPGVAAQKQRNRALAEQTMQDLALPANEYYERIRAIGERGGTASPVAPVPRGTPTAPAQPASPPPDFEAWRASRRNP